MALILVAEDDRFMANLCRHKLEDAGHEVILAENGEEALREASLRAPDLFMLDLMMPVVDGFGVLQFLKNHETLRHIPVIIVSSSKSLTDAVLDVDYPGRLAFFQKGEADFATLLKKVETLVYAHTGGAPSTYGKKLPSFITPRTPAEHPAVQEGEPPILIADDDSVMQQLVSFILTEQGYHVASAYDGQQTLDKAARQTPKLLILDCAMPSLDGLAVMDVWNKDEVLSTVPVIMLTADVDSGTHAEALGKGVVAFLNKPFSPADLIAHVKRFAGHPENAKSAVSSQDRG